MQPKYEAIDVAKTIINLRASGKRGYNVARLLANREEMLAKLAVEADLEVETIMEIAQDEISEA